MARKVVVIRVGTKTTHIVHMEDAKINPTIYGCVRIPTPENCFQDGMITDIVELARRIKKACQDKGIRTKEAIFTIASSKVASRETTIPVVNKSKVTQLVMSQVRDLFPVDPESYLFSYIMQGKPAPNEEGTQVQDVRVFAIPAEIVECYYTLAATAGMSVVAVEADLNSIFQMMSRQAGDGVMMAVQLNRTSTLVNIMNGEKLLLQRSIPYGINTFLEEMMQEEAFQVKDERSAYRMLRDQRVLMPHLNEENPTGDFSMEKRIEVTNSAEFLLSNIARVVEYYKSKYKDDPITEIVCVGLGCGVAGFYELLENEVGLPVRKLETLNGIRFNRKVAIDAALLQYVNCFGAVFQPVGFVPREIARKEAKKGALTGSLMIFLLLFVLSGVLAGLSLIQLYTATEERDTAQARNEALKPVQNEYNELTQIETNYNLYSALSGMLDTKGNHFHDLLDEISDVCPKSFKIQSVTANETDVTISAVSVDKLSSISKLQLQLSEVEGIKDVKINQISESKQALTKKRQYVYTMQFSYSDETDQDNDDADNGALSTTTGTSRSSGEGGTANDN